MDEEGTMEEWWTGVVGAGQEPSLSLVWLDYQGGIGESVGCWYRNELVWEERGSEREREHERE